MTSSFVENGIQIPPMAYLEPFHTSKMELWPKKLTALSIFAKKLVVLLGSAKVCENSTVKQISTLSV